MSKLSNLILADERENNIRKQFYQRLEEDNQLVAEFLPYQGVEEPPFFWEQMYAPANALFTFNQPGPTIKIFRLCKINSCPQE